MPSFIHAADLHLDSPLIGLSEYAGAPTDQIRGATRAALDNLVSLAIEERVAFVLIAGDLYDGDWKDFQTGLFFASRMAQLREAGVNVVIVSGNHDAASQITRRLRLPDNVTTLPARAPATVALDDVGVSIHGQSFARRAVTDDLSARYPEPTRGLLNIGLLHTALDGRPGHDRYAPCTLDGLRGKGYGYWALGHVHSREVLCQDPWVVFPGNTQGRHVREAGAKGCTLVTYEDGEVLRAEHRDLDLVRWAVCEVDGTECRAGDELADAAAAALAAELSASEGRPLAVRFRLTLTPAAHAEVLAGEEHWLSELRAAVTDTSAGSAWVEKVAMEEAAAELGGPAAEEVAAELLNVVLEVSPTAHELEQVTRDLGGLATKLRAEARDGGDAPDLESPEALEHVVEEARTLLRGRLSRQENGS